MAKLDTVILDIVESSARSIRTAPLLLGGLPGAGGGVGAPPGGFIGWLPQTRVSYDTDEVASNITPASGQSLLDNLKHIRHRLNVLESGASLNIWDDNSVIKYADVTDLHFSGAGITITNLGGGSVSVGVTATGSGGGGTALTIKSVNGNPTVSGVDTIVFSGFTLTDLGANDIRVSVSPNITLIDDLTTQVVTSGTHFNLTGISESGRMLLFYNGVYQKPNLFVLDSGGSGFTTTFPTYSGDSMVAIYGIDAFQTLRTTGGRSLIEEKTPTTSSVTFSSIPSGYNKLIIEVVARATAGFAVSMKVALNGDTTTTNYSFISAQDTALGHSSNSGADFYSVFSAIPGTDSPANNFCNAFIEILQYANTSFYKIVKTKAISLTGATPDTIMLDCMSRWANTSAVSSLTLNLTGGNFATGTTIRLYGEN